ncbi:galactokinase [Ramlibacter henchirensis]|uniref:Galactokinase n=1 Tax=Ramlibacter henchirensis TaxID=204072 RepID=A0A4Z0C627_9BURK|nr:galactokinase [Ramlibacter henchirensis]TFZ07063.1 galactokinase [Ramlibacter henchirensis]
MSHVALEAELQARAEQPRTPCSREFEVVFHGWPQAEAQAPGRVNLLGEHTDYNDGFVLPVAIPQQTRVAMRRSGRSHFRLHAAELGSTVEFTLEERPSEHFASYVYGCLRLAREEGAEVPPLDIHVASEVPMGVGLSSSAALEVATLRCLRELLGMKIDDVRIAQLGQQAEIQYAGVRCGILDQMASSLAATDRALLLDTRSLERRTVPLPQGSSVLVLDSGVARTLATSGYNQRRAECEEAARLLGVRSLREVEHLEPIEALPDVPRRRARHVFTENARVLRAVACKDARDFGELMNASHASLRDDYEVSTPELDLLVDLLQKQAGVYGARLTGAGFGGACVALCDEQAVPQVAQEVLAQYRHKGHSGRLLVPAAP